MRAFVGDQAVIPEGDNGGGLERGDILRPTRAVLKFIHNDDPNDSSGPMFEAFFEVNWQHACSVCGDQYYKLEKYPRVPSGNTLFS